MEIVTAFQWTLVGFFCYAFLRKSYAYDFNFAILAVFQTNSFSYSLCECDLPIMGKDSLFLFLKGKLEKVNNFPTAFIVSCFIKVV